MHHQHNKPFVFSHFGINQQRGSELYSMFMASVLHHCMCPDCGKHPIQQLAIEYMQETLLPDIISRKASGDTIEKVKIQLEEYSKERDFMWFQAGLLLTEHNEPMWASLAENHKRDTYENTLIELFTIAKDFFSSYNAPLN